MLIPVCIAFIAGMIFGSLLTAVPMMERRHNEKVKEISSKSEHEEKRPETDL